MKESNIPSSSNVGSEGDGSPLWSFPPKAERPGDMEKTVVGPPEITGSGRGGVVTGAVAARFSDLRGEGNYMERARLIFFASSDPRVRPEPAWRAYLFAKEAADWGLDTEVRLAGDAVGIALGEIADDRLGQELEAMVRDRARDRLLVSL